jgi:DnaJ domain
MLIIAAIIIVLYLLGFWPVVIRGIRELRGEHVEEPPSSGRTKSGPPASTSDLDICCKMLGISPSSPWEEIEKAYRRKAKLHHPDRGGDDDAMRALNDAYALLKKARKR